MTRSTTRTETERSPAVAGVAAPVTKPTASGAEPVTPRAEPVTPGAEPMASGAEPTADDAQETNARCGVCLEIIAAGVEICPECGEPTEVAIVTTGQPSIPDEPAEPSWLRQHWPPLVTASAILALIGSGVALRYLAPDRFSASRAASPRPPVPTCSAPCWSGEACQLGHCVWQRPNDVGHVASDPAIAGPFSLPKDASDALLLDGDRLAVALLTGMQVRSARTGEVLSLVSEAPQVRRLYHVGDVVYATAPSRIYVIDAATTRLLKTIELGATVGDVIVGASGRRALASLPTAHAVAILATEYHAEIERIQFGDDSVGPVAVDDTGTRALTTTGQIPLPGLRDAAGGVAYPFDPSRLGSEQDRVRTSMVGNPVSALMSPDGSTGFVALRAEDAIVPLTWLSSGAVRQEDRIPTCREPEQLALVRSERRVIVRCNEGRALQVLDLQKREALSAVTFNGRVIDLAVAPDGAQAVVALNGGDGTGSVALVGLKDYSARVFPLSAEPTRVRLSPDGGAALALSERAKVAWVLR